MAGGSAKAVYAAIGGNSLVMLAKFAAFALTGSGAMLSEGIHSMADVGNQCLLALGIRQSQKIADEEHPYGFAREQFVWALISAVGIFFLGCGVTLYHGIHSVMHPEPIEGLSTAVGVLIFAFVVEGWTLSVAVKAVKAGADGAGMAFKEYVIRGPDPMGIAVLLEDGAAVLGLFIAAAAIGMAHLTGDPIWDGIGSITIALLLGGVAVFLIVKNRQALIGVSMDVERRQALVDVLKGDPVVEEVLDVKATILGAESARFKAEIAFDGAAVARRQLEAMDLEQIWSEINSREALEAFLIRYGEKMIDALGDEIDRLEGEIRYAAPEVQHVDLEAD